MEAILGSPSTVGFNPRAREGATQKDGEPSGPALVSIHAPVKARRLSFFKAMSSEAVSIHAPVKARPRRGGGEASEESVFQSTRP